MRITTRARGYTEYRTPEKGVPERGALEAAAGLAQKLMRSGVIQGPAVSHGPTLAAYATAEEIIVDTRPALEDTQENPAVEKC